MDEKTDAVVGWLGRVERVGGAAAGAGKAVRRAVVAWAWLWGPVVAVAWWVCTGELVGWSVWGPLLDGLPWGR